MDTHSYHHKFRTFRDVMSREKNQHDLRTLLRPQPYNKLLVICTTYVRAYWLPEYGLDRHFRPPGNAPSVMQLCVALDFPNFFLGLML